ncbi:hypothetical protein H4J58_08260 [Colwellia sp. MB3u-70]|uniref:hypothetical protein n=1 Tax=unclassified Colwellia TaxID=196834 RepID=UPI0015F74C38|nr:MULTISPECIES: hypothetical protein [unclassified Colwellia]MBA6293121.1 hypothetical protein [Colwellia sp. MB3u-8]MBA6307107.1 hypothetical protein [Colwellia sp. MB3u-70]
MNNHQFLIVIAASEARMLKKTFEFFLPLSWFGDVPPESMLGRSIWVLIRSKTKDLLFCRLVNVELSQYGEEFDNGFAVYGEYLNSDYFYLEDCDTTISITEFSAVPIGVITRLNSKQSAFIKNKIETNQSITPFILSSVRKRLPEVNLFKSTDSELLRLERHCRQTFLYQQAPKHPSHPKNWSPFKSLAVRILCESEDKNKTEILASAKRHHPQVPFFDDNFTSIDPTKVFARRFIKRNHTNEEQSEEFLKKTECAEKKHQEILVAVTKHLIASGYTPMQSRSIDLLLRLPGRLIIFEIKSATQDNVKSQCRKALSQLLEYAHNMKGVHNNVELVLITEGNKSEIILDYFDAIFEASEIALLRYDSVLTEQERFIALDFLVASQQLVVSI